MNDTSVSGRLAKTLYKIEKERLKGTETDLTSFLFNRGANFYVFSYEKNSEKRHTLVDACDYHYRAQMMSFLINNGINPSKIERIIITHCHRYHYGVTDLLARESGARLLVHPNFKVFVAGQGGEEERRWGNFNPIRFTGCDIEYLPSPDNSKVRNISGVNFPILGGPIEIGTGVKLEILGCPESTSTHSPDQIIVCYTPGSCPRTISGDFRPTNDLLFSGDLWLMRGPARDRSIRETYNRLRRRFYAGGIPKPGKSLLPGVPREQDTNAKEALKRGFSLIKVKPGHGKEFIGSRIIPSGLLAERDLSIELASHMDKDGPALKKEALKTTIDMLTEQAYISFIQELHLWAESGYTSRDMVELLVRIYQEQSEGDRAARKDRKQRRQKLKATLGRLSRDEAQSQQLHQLAEATLLELKKVS